MTVNAARGHWVCRLCGQIGSAHTPGASMAACPYRPRWQHHPDARWHERIGLNRRRIGLLAIGFLISVVLGVVLSWLT